MNKPCPFCGEKHNFLLVTGGTDKEGVSISIACKTCGSNGPWKYVDPKLSRKEREKEAFEQWNKRR